jgi:hypothetical protein
MPGQKKVTIQIPFGRETHGQFTGQNATKKVEEITINWVRQPKKFMLYTWRPGFSWTLRETFINYKEKITQISLYSEEISAIMIEIEDGYEVPEYNSQIAYAIRSIYIGYNALPIKLVPCLAVEKKYKLFDFDKQHDVQLPNTNDYISEKAKLSITFEKVVADYHKIKANLLYIKKAKAQAQGAFDKLGKFVNGDFKKAMEKLKNFKNDLHSLQNSQFEKTFKTLANGKNNISHNVKIGTKENPAENCLHLKHNNPNIISGFYYIQPECAKIAIRVFCDFALFDEAVDIFVFNDGNSEIANADLSYLQIKDENSVRYQCARYGFEPLQINNESTIQRINHLLVSMGYNMNQGVVPLGYDYDCAGNKCNENFKSLNGKETPSINTFFTNNMQNNTNNKDDIAKSTFAGLGSNFGGMTMFKPNTKRIMALICSTNQTKVYISKFLRLSCDASMDNNIYKFKLGVDVSVSCPKKCQQSEGKVNGSSLFDGSSSICKAAIQKGLITNEGGKVNVRLMRSNLTSRIDNESNSDHKFVLFKYVKDCPVDRLKLLSGISQESSFTEQEISEGLLDNDPVDILNAESLLEQMVDPEVIQYNQNNPSYDPTPEEIARAHKSSYTDNQFDSYIISEKAGEDLEQVEPRFYQEGDLDELKSVGKQIISGLPLSNPVKEISQAAKKRLPTLSALTSAAQQIAAPAISDITSQIAVPTLSDLSSQLGIPNLQQLPSQIANSIKQEAASKKNEATKQVTDLGNLVAQNVQNQIAKVTDANPLLKNVINSGINTILPSMQPINEEDKQTTDPGKCDEHDIPAITDKDQITTDKAIEQIKTLRVRVDHNEIKILEEKFKKAKVNIEDFIKSLQWNNENDANSKISYSNIKSN